MMLSRQRSKVDALAADATLQKTRLVLLGNDVRRWKRQTFARPDALLLAFLAGFVVGPSGSTKHTEERESEESGGQPWPIKALEASFLAWRLFGRQVTTGATSQMSAAGEDAVQ